MAPLAEAFVRIRPDWTGFRPDTERGIAGAGLGKLGETHGAAFGRAFGTRAGIEAGTSMQAKFRDIGGKLGPGLLAAAGGLGIKAAFDKIIGGASDLNETVSKTQQVFGASAGSILRWSQDSATAMGLSRRAALEGASSFENLFSQIGITGDVATGMSKNLVKLSSDFASFQNADPAAVMDALLSATRGEYDALQRFVPTVSAAAIQAQALADSGKSSASALTDAEKATALYELVTKGAGAAVGDFARTSGGAANQQRILKAQVEDTAASVGNVLLPAYTGVLRAVNDIGPGTLAAAAGVAVLGNRIAATGAGAGAFKDMQAAFRLYTESVASGTPRVSAALDTAKAATTGLKGAASGVVGLFGGPWGAAATGATLAAGFFATEVGKSHARVDQLATSLGTLVEAYRKTQSLTDQTSRELLKHDQALADLVLHTDRYGVSVQTLLSAESGQPGVLETIRAAQEKTRASQGGLTQSQAEAYGALIKLAEQGKRNVDVDRELDAQQGKTAASTANFGLQQQVLAGILAQGNQKIADSAGLADALKGAWDRLFGAGVNLTDGEESLAAAHDTVRTTVEAARQAHDANARSLELNTAAGRTNRDNLEALITSTNSMYTAEIAAGVGVTEATRRHGERIVKVREEAGAVGFNRDRTEELIGTYGRVPTDVTTNVRMTGAETVLNQLRDLAIAQRSLSEGITIQEAARLYGAAGRSPADVFTGHATGGPITGPGSGTSDSIPARLSAGEHVWTAAEVQAAGGHVAVEAIRKFVLHDRSPQVRRPGDGSEGIAYAGGGAVWPFPVTASKTKIPDLGSVGPALAVQQWIRAQAGKPYIWAGAGPGGFDCSGVVGAAWLALHGRGFGQGQRVFSTMNEAGFFPLAGAGGVMTAAWANAGERGGGSVGHTAARVGGLMFESRGGAGVVVGSGVTPLSSFAHMGHFAGGGRVSPLPARSYDKGGWLPTGASIAVNGTGGPERVGPGRMSIDGDVSLDGYTIRRIGTVIADVVSQAIGAAIQVREHQLGRQLTAISRGG